MIRWWPALLVLPLAFLSGCDSPPSAIEVPKFDPASASAKALEDYDKNKDGALDKKELESVPGIAGNLEIWDTNKDGKVSKEEIYARVEKFAAEGSGIITYSCEIQFNGKPLDGAEVTFVPEPFLGPVLKTATGKSGFGGTAPIQLSAADLPPGQKEAKGMQPGVYKIEVTHPTIKIPDRYNTKTTLGAEVSAQASGRSGLPVFKLMP